MVLATVVGSYPRIGDALEEQRLRRAIAKFEEEKLTDGELREVERSVVREVLAHQIDNLLPVLLAAPLMDCLVADHSEFVGSRRDKNQNCVSIFCLVHSEPVESASRRD